MKKIKELLIEQIGVLWLILAVISGVGYIVLSISYKSFIWLKYLAVISGLIGIGTLICLIFNDPEETKKTKAEYELKPMIASIKFLHNGKPILSEINIETPQKKVDEIPTKEIAEALIRQTAMDWLDKNITIKYFVQKEK